MEEEVKNKYLIGIVGAIIGAIIGAIPWVLAYVFLNVIYSVLAILIVAGSFYGYKLTKAKINKKVPVILSISSFIAITLVMLLIIPICYLYKMGYPISMEYLQAIYSVHEFQTAILTDYVISLIFGIIVIGGIVVSLNKQIREGIKEEDIRILAKDASTEDYSKEDINKVRQIFDRNDALDKKHTITKDLVMEDLIKEFGESKANSIFTYLKVQQIIKKKSNKYYFCEKAQNSSWYRYGMSGAKTFIIILIIAVVLAAIIVFSQRYQNEEQQNALSDPERLTNNIYEVETSDIKVDMPDDVVILTDEEVGQYLGTQYIGIYDCVGVSTDFERMVMVFTDEKSNYEEEYTAEEYLTLALGDEAEEVEVEKTDVNGNEYYYVEQPYTSSYNDKNYVTSTYVLDSGDKFICIILDSPEDNQLNIDEIVK